VCLEVKVRNLVPSLLCAVCIIVTHVLLFVKFPIFFLSLCFAEWVYNLKTERNLGANWNLRTQVMFRVQCL
jgi:hypothetical protein